MAGKHVLVVDDELAVRELVDGLVRYCGHSPQTAASGAEAVVLLESTLFDLVITDLHMPGMKGDALASIVKSRFPGIPVILITGDEHQPPSPDVDRILLKPFSVTQLRAVMSELIEDYRTMKFAICNEIFSGWKLADAFSLIAGCGYDAVEIAPFTISDYVTDIPSARREEIRALARAHRLQISGIHWVLAHTEGLHLTHPEAAVRERTSRYLGELVDFCADLGGKFMVVGSPKQRSLLNGVQPREGLEWALAVLRPSVARAEERGVTICIEPLSPAETNFIHTAAEAIDLIRRLESAHLKIILDVKAMSSESKPIPEIIRDSWPHFAYFHANDKNLKGPGFGEVDFGPIALALKQTGYRGYVSVEVFNFDEGPEVIARKSIEYLRRVFA